MPVVCLVCSVVKSRQRAGVSNTLSTFSYRRYQDHEQTLVWDSAVAAASMLYIGEIAREGRARSLPMWPPRSPRLLRRLPAPS